MPHLETQRGGPGILGQAFAPEFGSAGFQLQRGQLRQQQVEQPLRLRQAFLTRGATGGQELAGIQQLMQSQADDLLRAAFEQDVQRQGAVRQERLLDEQRRFEQILAEEERERQRQAGGQGLLGGILGDVLGFATSLIPDPLTRALTGFAQGGFGGGQQLSPSTLPSGQPFLPSGTPALGELPPLI